MTKEISYIQEVGNLPIGEAARDIERAERLSAVTGALAERALDLATDPATPQGEALLATHLYRRIADISRNGNEHAAAKTDETGVWAELSVERKDKAAATIVAMAEKFGVRMAEFDVLKVTQEDGTSKLLVAHMAPNGIDLGNPDQEYDEKRSWNSIFSPENDHSFMIEANGETVDTRTGMTEAAYRAFIEDARASDTEHLPDSQPLSEANDQPWTWTLLTGEEADPGGAPFARRRRRGPPVPVRPRRRQPRCPVPPRSGSIVCL